MLRHSQATLIHMNIVTFVLILLFALMLVAVFAVLLHLLDIAD